MSFVGVDLHTNSFTACRREADGSERFETFTLSPADLERFCLTLDADDEVAFEATGNSAWFRDQILPCAGRVVVVNPAQFKVIRQSVKKTDRNDARALALFLAKDMLPETRAKTQAESELGSLTQTRDLLVKQRTRLLNKGPCPAQPPRHQAQAGELGEPQAAARDHGRTVHPARMG